MAKLLAHLERLARELFFGQVTVSFQAGKVTNIKVERNMKLEDL